MTIHISGYVPADSERVRREAEFELLRTNLVTKNASSVV